MGYKIRYDTDRNYVVTSDRLQEHSSAIPLLILATTIGMYCFYPSARQVIRAVLWPEGTANAAEVMEKVAMLLQRGDSLVQAAGSFFSGYIA